MERTKRTKADKPVEKVEASIEEIPGHTPKKKTPPPKPEKVKVIEKEEKPLEVKVRPLLEYRVLYNGFNFRKKRFSAGATFEAYPEEIPVAFMDKLICLSSAEKIDANKYPFEKKPLEKLYEIEKNEKGFVVVNKESGKIMNENKMTQSQAEKLRDTLNS